MADLISVLIVDDNVEFCKLIEKNLNGVGSINIVGSAGNGVSAIEMISELEPDLVLLDVIMPNLDGLGVLEWIAKEKPVKRPLILVYTSVGGDMIVQRALELGADYYMLKPVDIDLLTTRIIQLYNESHSDGEHGRLISSIRPATNHIERIITDLIKKLGVMPNLAGYSYLREAVLLAIEDPERLKSLSSSIYPELARNHNTNVRNIDRAIRCAIDSAYRKTNNVNNSIQCEYMTLSGKKRPNNARIISFLADQAVRRRNKQLSE